MTLTHAEKAAITEEFAKAIGPLMAGILNREVDKAIEYDEDVWACFIDALTGPIKDEILWGPHTRGPHCVACDSEGGEWDPDHEFTPRDRGGQPPCLCNHLLSAHSKGERGQNHPQYWAFEALERGTLAEPGQIAFAYRPGPIRALFTVLMDFDAYRDRILRKFKVKRPDGSLPG